jgi:hypothetical protein
MKPREYDREYTRPLPGAVQIRLGRDVDQGVVSRFFVQLEYAHEDGWRTVVRYDHDSKGSDEATHDVTEEGLHVDIYRNEEKYATEFIVGPMPANAALDHAEDHLARNLERFVQRYEEWHEIREDR